MSNRCLQLGLISSLAVAVVVSSVWVIKAKHQSRQLFVELEELNRERDRWQIDWGRLQLEQSTWGTHPRIESLASQRLNLASPRPDEVVVIVEPSQ